MSSSREVLGERTDQHASFPIRIFPETRTKLLAPLIPPPDTSPSFFFFDFDAWKGVIGHQNQESQLS
jgi:hypothetical protein